MLVDFWRHITWSMLSPLLCNYFQTVIVWLKSAVSLSLSVSYSLSIIEYILVSLALFLQHYFLGLECLLSLSLSFALAVFSLSLTPLIHFFFMLSLLGWVFLLSSEARGWISRKTCQEHVPVIFHLKIRSKKWEIMYCLKKVNPILGSLKFVALRYYF